ncbi:UTRA domain-containing protein, partial [Cohnella sp. GbtcB17]|uniref:UTRA domain-containing protein n=1 Tax=Cohnella sp. GbtcB17 TaxID=2824762 RepID=UPI001C30B81F
WQAVRVATAHGKVQSVTHNVQVPDLGLRHRKRDLNKRPMVAILRSEGVQVKKIRWNIQATTPPPVAARYLGVSLDSPVLM